LYLQTTTGSERKQWDKEKYALRAREKDAEYAERAREREEALKTGEDSRRRLYISSDDFGLAGKKVRRKEVLPKATKLLEARDEPLELDKNLNKTIIIASGRPGFSCETCKRTLKDSASYLDHVNGRYRGLIFVRTLILERMTDPSVRLDLRKLGQTTKVQRSTLQQVQAKIQELREISAKKMDAKKYDFEQRLKELKELDEEQKQTKREQKRADKEAAEELRKKQEQESVDPEMAAMMGFSAFN